MKKWVMLGLIAMALSLGGCGGANDRVVHRDGNLIVTNYAEEAITDTTISHLGETIAASPQAIKDTEVCYFKVAPAKAYTYTVSFVDSQGAAHEQEFTDDFTEDDPILLAIRCTDGVWSIGYDK